LLLACTTNEITSTTIDAGAGGDGPAATADAPRPIDGPNAVDARPAIDAVLFDAGTVVPPTTSCTPPEQAPDTSNPTAVVGTGPGTCNEAALAAAVAQGGIIVFNCGTGATIAVTQTLNLRTDIDTVIDGGGKVTLDGGGTTQILSFNHPNYRVNDVRLTLMRITLTHGKISGTDPYDPAPVPCSQGFYDGYGGALYVRDGVVLVIDASFIDNVAEMLGPDVGGAGISLNGVKKATVIGSTFRGGVASNGGGIQCLNCDLDIYNSTFEGNRASGNGANGDDDTKCAVVAKNGQNQIGSGGNGGAVVIDGGSDGTHTFCGVTFRNNQAGADALGGAIFRTPDLAKQTTIIDRCLFDGNTATNGGGGALYMHNSTLQIVASTFRGNTARAFGAIQSDGTTYDLVNDTFESNQANAVAGSGGVGGVLALFGGSGRIQNSTFANNTATGFAAVIFGTPMLAIDNCIFSNNTAPNPGAPMQCQIDATGANNLQFPQNHVSGGAADALCAPGITFADAKLSPMADNGGATPTMLPQTGSPALGKGQNCPAFDQRGTARPSSNCTAGAVEGTQ
jgi:predicted outer membrane repeat protein